VESKSESANAKLGATEAVSVMMRNDSFIKREAEV